MLGELLLAKYELTTFTKKIASFDDVITVIFDT